MHAKSWLVVGALSVLVVASGWQPAWGQRRGGRGNSAQQMQMIRQQQIAAAQQQLAQGKQALNEAEAAIGKYKDEIATATGDIEGAKKTIDEAKSTTVESRKSLKSIEADILAAQKEDSDYGRANAALTKAQDEVKAAKEAALGGEGYLAQRAAILQEENHAVKLAKYERQTLTDNLDYQRALDRAKSAKAALDRVKTDLFKANADWASATAAAREASAEESKARLTANKGAVKKTPAMRNLKEAEEAAQEARQQIAQATSVLQQFNALPKQPQQRKKKQ